MSRMRALSPALVMTLLLVAGCAAPPLGREGATADPVTLTSLWGNGPSGIGADVLDALTTSDVSPEITVTAPPDETRAQVDDYEGATIALLQAGEGDVSVIRADRLAMAGATSLMPLTAPMTVMGSEHAAAIAAAPVAHDLMADLDELGLVGIALAPGGTRRLFGYQTALTDLDEMRGAVINTRVGAGVDAIFAALGASTEHSTGEERAARAASGASRGIEIALQQLGAVDLPAVMTTNIDLYTKFDVVVITQNAWDALSAAQQTALDARVHDAIASATSERQSDADALGDWCRMPGASTAVATSTQRARFDTALQLARDQVEAEPGMAGLFAAIDALAPHQRPADLGSCDQTVADDPYTVQPVGDQTVLDGTWRLEMDRDSLAASGMPRTDILANTGIWTIHIQDGIATVDQPTGDDCTWQLQFDGDQVSLNWGALGNTACYGLARGTFRRDGDRVSFDFEAERDYSPEWDDAFFANGMVQIADD